MHNHYIVCNKGQSRFCGNVAEIIEYFFTVSDELGCRNPQFNYGDDGAEIIFDGYHCDVKFKVATIHE